MGISNEEYISVDLFKLDIANVEPFNNFDIVEMFGEMIPKMVDIVNTLHNSIEVA